MKRLLAFALILGLACAPVAALAQSTTPGTPGVCETVYIVFNDDTAIAILLNMVTTQIITVNLDNKLCPTGSEAETVAALAAQIRSLLITGTDFNGKLRLVPPGQVKQYILPNLYTPNAN
jgi:hypothetical protein